MIVISKMSILSLVLITSHNYFLIYHVTVFATKYFCVSYKFLKSEILFFMLSNNTLLLKQDILYYITFFLNINFFSQQNLSFMLWNHVIVKKRHSRLLVKKSGFFFRLAVNIVLKLFAILQLLPILYWIVANVSLS